MKLSDEIIKKGFWSIDVNNHLEYNTDTEIVDYQPKEKLRLLITQLSHKTASQQNKLVDAWCDFLPTLSEVKYLWLPSRVSQKIFDSICEMNNLEGLWIKWSGIKSIDKLPNLKNLKHLHIGSSGQIESIKAFGQMKNLVTLETEQLNKVTDFSILSNLSTLEGLGIDGSIGLLKKSTI